MNGMNGSGVAAKGSCDVGVQLNHYPACRQFKLANGALKHVKSYKQWNGMEGSCAAAEPEEGSVRRMGGKMHAVK